MPLFAKWRAARNAEKQRKAQAAQRADDVGFLAGAGFEEIEGGHLRLGGFDYLPTNPHHSDSFRTLLCAAGIDTTALSSAFARWARGPWKMEGDKFKCCGRQLPCIVFATQSNISNTIVARVEVPEGVLPEIVAGEPVPVTDEISATSLALAFTGHAGRGCAVRVVPVDEQQSGFAYLLVDCSELDLKASPVELAHGAATLASRLVVEEHLTGLRAAIANHGMEGKETECDEGFIIEVGDGEVVFKLSTDKMLREILVLAPGGRNTELGQRLAAAPPPAPPVLQDWQKALRAAVSGRLTESVEFTIEAAEAKAAESAQASDETAPVPDAPGAAGAEE